MGKQKDLVFVHAFVLGQVQGVGFRFATIFQARKLGVSGWVRNRRDGTVEVKMIGPSSKVEKLLSWLKEGPPLARVDQVIIKEKKTVAKNTFGNRFEKRPTL